MTNGWNLQQINNANGISIPGEYVSCPAATVQTPTLAPFVSVYNNQQHFAYTDVNGNIQDVWWDGDTSQWKLQQINNANGQGPSVPGEYIACPEATARIQGGIGFSPIVSVYNNQQHFTYYDSNGNIQDVWWDGAVNQWKLQQINNANGQGPSVPDEYIACPAATAQAIAHPLFVSVYNNQQHFTYYDSNGNIQDVWWDGEANQWKLQQINNANDQGASVPGEYIASTAAT